MKYSLKDNLFDFTAGVAWQIKMRDARGDWHERSSADSVFTHGDDGALCWRCADGIQVRSQVTTQADGMYAFSLEVTNGSAFRIEEIAYPIIELERDSEEALVLPWQIGARIVDPVGAVAKDEFMPSEWTGAERRAHQFAAEYPGIMAMQFMALESHGEVLYYGIHDGAANYKRFGLYGAQDCTRAQLCAKHFPASSIMTGEHYAMPYPVVIGKLEGDWFAAAQYYRAWATKQEWCQCGKTRQRKDLPAWIDDIGVWYWNWVFANAKGDVDTVLPVLKVLQERTGLPCALHWYGWNNQCHDNDYPDYAIDEVGKERLAQAVAAYHDAGMKVFPYLNGRLWNIDTQSWHDENAGHYACLKNPEAPGAKRHYYVEPYMNHPFVPMCPATEFWQQKVLKNVARVLEFGLDGAYIDQITSSFAVCCWNESHGHTSGGNYWYRGYREMMRKIREYRAGHNPQAIMTSESVIECYISDFDLYLGYQAAFPADVFGRTAQTIPLFAAIYGDYIPVYGTGTLAKNDDFFLGQAMDIEHGVRPSLQGIFAADLTSPECAERLQWLNAWAKLRHQANERLKNAHLVALPPLTTECIQTRLCGTPITTPVVRGSLWRDDDTGAQVLVAVNHTAEAHAITLPEECAWWNFATGAKLSGNTSIPPYTVQLFVQC